MNRRKAQSRLTSGGKGKYVFGLLGIVIISCLLVIFLAPRFAKAPDLPMRETDTMQGKDKAVAANVQREALDFQMVDFTHGWIAYTDGIMKTDDGGVHWYAAAPESLSQTSAEDDALNWTKGSLPNLHAITVQSKEIEVKKSQFLTESIGWALLSSEEQAAAPLWVTTDSGKTWNHQVTKEVVKEIEAERQRLQNIGKEASYYADIQAARKAIQSEWTLMPGTAAPGDILLVRHRTPGDVTWQGKTYELQPFGSGYFTYLPVSINTKPGRYPIGDQALTVKEKKFETQYLQVTKQMESMRQDTKRIQEDQMKIDRARSKSEPEFVFSAPFIQPLEGILTTPFGYTRYVNGKFDSSHMAIDLAAKEGTPIKATNDGVVALAESLYLTGNSIYIDHGMHLFSQYAHLSELRVKAGDRVKQGDIIGLVGTTGFSTGPHLHFTFWAHNVPVNPNLFFSTRPFHWFLPGS